MKYMVTARWWNDELQTAFGEDRTEHALTADEIVEAIEKFGRASIRDSDTARWGPTNAEKILNFENDYD